MFITFYSSVDFVSFASQLLKKNKKVTTGSEPFEKEPWRNNLTLIADFDLHEASIRKCCRKLHVVFTGINMRAVGHTSWPVSFLITNKQHNRNMNKHD